MSGCWADPATRRTEAACDTRLTLLQTTRSPVRCMARIRRTRPKSVDRFLIVVTSAVMPSPSRQVDNASTISKVTFRDKCAPILFALQATPTQGQRRPNTTSLIWARNTFCRKARISALRVTGCALRRKDSTGNAAVAASNNIGASNSRNQVVTRIGFQHAF